MDGLGPILISFLTGEGNYPLTGQLGLWNGEPTTTVKSKTFSSLKTTTSSLSNPWRYNVPVTGTNGYQFSPQLNSDSILEIFFADWSRPIAFSYASEEQSASKKFQQITFTMQETQMTNKTETSVNTVFDIWVTGTSNLTSSLSMPSFVSNSYFYGVTSSDVVDSIPIIKDANGNLIQPTKDSLSWFAVEPLSGITLAY